MTWSEQQSTAVLRCLPLSATRLVKMGMGVVLKNLDLWPRCVERWNMRSNTGAVRMP